MTEQPEPITALPAPSKGWAVLRLLWSVALLGLVVVSTATHNDRVFGYLGAVTGMVLLERRYVQEGRSPFFNGDETSLDLALGALVGAFVALLLWSL